MAKTLRDYFPMIQTREEVLEQIQKQEELFLEYSSWEEEKKEEFLHFCTGAQGVKITYDSFFKEIMSPEYHPERLEELLSLLIGEKVVIRQVLPNDSVRLADESTLLVTDIVVEMENGSYSNIEIQKIGYAFPGQRCACYSADLLLRQYKRVKGIRKDKFIYRDIKTVYTIVFFENSTKEFKMSPEHFIHRSKQSFDTGLKLDLLQEFILIPLDIYKKNKENRVIESRLEAWLGFFSFDEPRQIISLLEQYPEFKAMYEEVYDICLNMERVMEMFSKELLELDRNTVQYMIEEQQELLNQKKEEIKQRDVEIKQMDIEIRQRNKELEKNATQIKELMTKLAEYEKKQN